MPEPLYRSVPAYSHSNGDLAARLADQVGLPLDVDQRAVLDAAFAEKAPDIPAAGSVAVIAPRQGFGKTTLFEIAALTDVFLLSKERVVWSAHEFKTARQSFEHMCGLIDAVPDFRRRCRPPRATSGQEAIHLRSGARVSFHARSKSAVRGLTGDVVMLDEALFLTDAEMGALLPVLATRAGAQVRYASSAGLPQSEVLRGVRDRGRAGTDPGLAYFEWGSVPVSCEGHDCPHLPAGEVPGCALDDRTAWRKANPSLGDRVSEEALERFRREMAPREFAREFLSHWDDPVDTAGSVIPADLWAACGDSSGTTIAGRVSFGLAVSDDQMWSSIAAAGVRPDGLQQVEIVATQPGTGWVADRVAQLTSRWDSSGVTLDPSSPAGALLPQLRQRGAVVQEIAGRELAQACGAFRNAVTDGAVRHLNNPPLDLSVRLARTRSSVDSWVWSARSSSVDISPLLAATLALHQLVKDAGSPAMFVPIRIR